MACVLSAAAAMIGLWVLPGPGWIKVRGEKRPRPILLRIAGATLCLLGCLAFWLLITGQVTPPA